MLSTSNTPLNLPTVKTSFYSKYTHSKLGLNPNIDIKTTAINDHTLAFQSIESEVRKGITYINMKASFLDTPSGTIQTITFPTSEKLRVDNGLLPQPAIFPNKNYGVGWRKQAGYGLSIVEQKNETWAIKCSNLFEDVLPQTSQPLLLGHINGSFTLLTGHDDYNYDSVFFRLFNSECVQVGSPKELSTPRVNLVEFYAKKINEETAILCVHHGDGSSETIKFEAKTGKILTKRSDSDYPMSQPYEMEPGIFSSLKMINEEFITININANMPTLVRNSKISELEFKDPIDRAFGFAPGPNNTFLALQYSKQQLFGTLTNQTGKPFGLPFSLNNIPERPTAESEAVVLLPTDFVQFNNSLFMTIYHNDSIEFRSLELTLSQINAPTSVPTLQPSLPHIRSGQKNDTSNDTTITILATILGVIGGIGLLVFLYKYCFQKGRENNQEETQNRYIVTPSAPPAPPEEFQQIPIAYPVAPLEITNTEPEKK